MPVQPFQTIALKSISKGIDQRSVETAIADGYCEDIVNADVNSNGFITKRAGYQGYYGYVPVRVESVVHQDNVITFSLDESIDVSNLQQSPLFVYGQLPAAQTGDLSVTPVGRWYPSFHSGIRDQLNPGLTTVVKGVNLTHIASSAAVVGVALATSQVDNSNTAAIPDAVRVDKATFEVDVDFTMVAAAEAYVWVADKATVAGKSYAAAFGSTTSLTVPTGTHALANTNIICKVYQDLTTYWKEVIPATMTIDPVGNVNVTFATATAGQIVLWSAPDANLAAATFTGTSTIVIPGQSQPFAFFGCYALNTLTGNFDQIIPSAIAYDAPAKTYTVTLTTAAGSDSVIVYYDFGSISSNKIKVLDTTTLSTSVAYTYPSAAGAEQQLTVWGIPQQAVSATTKQGGWVHALDTYRRTGESRVVCGLGGNLFTARSRAEAGTTYLMPRATATDNQPVVSPGATTVTSVGPTFYATGVNGRDVAGTFRPVVKGDDIVGNAAVVTDATFNGGTGWVDYTLAITNKTGTLVASLDTAAGREDWLTVTGSGHHNGVFKVMAVVDTLTGGVVSVLNPAITTSDYDETGATARAGVFTDQITFYTPPRFVPGDVLAGSLFTGITPTVVSVYSPGPLLVADGFTSSVLLADNKLLGVTRTADVVLLDSAVDLVPGDMTKVTGLTREVRVLHVQPYADVDLTLTAAAGTVTAVTGSQATIASINIGTGLITTTAPHGLLTNQPIVFKPLVGAAPARIQATLTYYVLKVSSTTLYACPTVNGSPVVPAALAGATIAIQRVHNLSVGQRVVVAQSGIVGVDGVQTVAGIVDDHTFTYASTGVGAGSGVLVGMAAQIDEALTVNYDLAAPTTFEVVGRWIPVEAPTTTGDIPKTTTVKHFASNPYDAQPTTRSTMVANGLYLTNGADEVLKFDGSSLYQAGLFRWQPQLFVTVDTTGTAALIQSSSLLNYTAVDTVYSNFTTPNATSANVGDRYFDPVSGKLFTVTSTQINTDAAGATNRVYVTPDVGVSMGGTAPGTLRRVQRYYYYFRLVAYDANNNIIASAATGQRDYVVELTSSANIHHKLVGMPAWNFYDYDRVNLQVFRTAANAPGAYFLVRSIPLSVSSTDSQYVDFIDNVTDSSLQTVDEAATGTGVVAKASVDVGTTWEQPPRAKYVTSIGNRLVLLNIQDYPQFNIVLRARPGAGIVTPANLVGLKWLFRRDGTNAGTLSNMADRQVYEFVDTTTSKTVTGVTVTTPGVGSATTFEVTTSAAHGRVAGDWVYLYYDAAGNDRHPKFAGWWVVAAATSATKFTVAFVDDGTSPAAVVTRCAVATASPDVPVLLGVDGSYGWFDANPPAAVSYETIAMIRLANAINVTTKVWQTYAKLAALPYSPWMVGNAGSEYPQLGQLVVRQPKAATVSMSLVTPTISAGNKVDVYIDNVKQASAATYAVTTKIFGSRAVLSYANFPEIFDNPAAVNPNDSVVDINAADGQEITGGLPFFSEAVFGTGQAEGLLVIFKTSSIYVYDLIKRQLQKVESHGLGCTAPYTIAPTKDGIMFANQSGMYRLNRDLTVVYVGRFMERLWLNSVNRDSLSTATGHFYGIGRQYKLSVPVGSDTRNSQVYVYDYTQETSALSGVGYGDLGGWVRYTNHPATAWCNLLNDAFFGTTTGQVMKVRVANDATDYRDDAAAVDTTTVLLKITDFGVASRKLMGWVVSQIRVAKSNNYGTQLSFAVDSKRVFEPTAAFRFTLDTVSGHKVYSVRTTPPTRRGKQFQLQYTNSTKDEEMTLAGVEFVVSQLSFQGTQEKADTT